LTNPNFYFRFLYILFFANPNRRWTATSPRNPKILWMIQENFTAKKRREAQAKKLEIVDPKA
jgi:hypothetical protein